MAHLFVGVSEIHLIFRYAKSLKDKRQPIKSISQKLKNRGFSVTECGNADDIKKGTLGIAFAGHSYTHVENELTEMEKLLIGDFQIGNINKEVFDYSTHEDKPLFNFEDEDEPWKKD